MRYSSIYVAYDSFVIQPGMCNKATVELGIVREADYEL